VLSIGILLALGPALYASRRIVTPLRRVSAAIDAIDAGNLTARANVHPRADATILAVVRTAA
jgi:nitrogen fixation/metabolism regulation signal transduction histidine kinase